MAIENLGRLDRFVAGAVGRPGQRTFFLQATAAGQSSVYAVEKDQVAALATQGLDLIRRSGVQADPVTVRRIIAEGLDLEEPLEPRFRVESIGLGVDASHLVVVSLASVEQAAEVNFAITPEQFQAAAVVALQVVASGRPICPRCGLPQDPDGHNCPSVNGHFPH
jgi:uncharacterized repeat protein (TIGR03847 family)